MVVRVRSAHPFRRDALAFTAALCAMTLGNPVEARTLPATTGAASASNPQLRNSVKATTSKQTEESDREYRSWLTGIKNIMKAGVEMFMERAAKNG